MAERPLGVTIIAILGFIGAVFLILGGVATLALGGIGATIFESILPGFGLLLGAVLGVIGAILLTVGILQFGISYGLWKMKKWAWLIEIIFLVLGILINLASIVSSPVYSIIGVATIGLVLYYLWTKKALFT